MKSLAFPAISTGIYGFPKTRAAGILAGLLSGYFRGRPKLDEIRLVFFSSADAEVFLAAAEPLLRGAG